MACIMRQLVTGNVTIIFTDKGVNICMHVPNGITIDAKQKTKQKQATFFERINSCSANGIHREVFIHKMYALSTVQSKETILLRKLL